MSVEHLSSSSILADFVSAHYSQREDFGKGKRSEDDAEMLRYLNNWIKTVLLKKFTPRIFSGRKILVMDLCCGKGGDLNKWERMQIIGALWMADNAKNSVKHAVDRYNSAADEGRIGFPIQAAAVDCARIRLSTIPGFYPRDLFFDMVSCQFSFHYCFESEERARAMLLNTSEQLRPGGYFVATIPDANVLVRNCRESNVPDGSFGNSKFRVRFTGEHWDAQNHKLILPKEKPFGIKYYFTLNNAVEDCPEFLVHFPTLEKLAEEYGLRLVYKANFHQIYFEYSGLENRDRESNPRHLLMNMVYRQNGSFIPPDEWRVAYMYLGFAFQKVFKDGETDQSVEAECFKNYKTVMSQINSRVHHVQYRDIYQV
jgi:mRNA (guanine-N7-)-methyltransferase